MVFSPVFVPSSFFFPPSVSSSTYGKGKSISSCKGGFLFPASSSSLLNGEKMIYSGATANRKTNFVRLEWKNAKKAESKIFVLFCFVLFLLSKYEKQTNKKCILQNFILSLEFTFKFLRLKHSINSMNFAINIWDIFPSMLISLFSLFF